MAPNSKSCPRKYGSFEKELVSMQLQLRSRLNDRLEEVSIDHEPDDDAALATSTFSSDLAAATLERERRTLEEIEAALRRMKSGDYGTCASCGASIPEARLRALPWAQVCVACAELMSAPSADRRSRLAAD
jgi:DnaK suppressor protein